MKTEEPTERPVFKYSLRPNQIGIGLTTAFFLFLAVFGIVSGEVGAGILTLAFVGLGSYMLFRSWSNDLQKAVFYEEFVGLTRKGLTVTMNIPYSDIYDVKMIRSFPMFEPRNRISIRIKSGESPLVVMGNPWSKHLKVDLATWLAKKV